MPRRGFPAIPPLYDHDIPMLVVMFIMMVAMLIMMVVMLIRMDMLNTRDPVRLHTVII